MQESKTMDIGEVARRSGLPVSTLRYYEEKGLIQSIGRHGLRRLFSPTVIEQLSLIALGRYAGFSLEEIAGMFSPTGQARIDRAQLLEKAAELEQTITRLRALREGLLHVAHCPESNQLECPKFQQLVRKAARTQLKARPARK